MREASAIQLAEAESFDGELVRGRVIRCLERASGAVISAQGEAAEATVQLTDAQDRTRVAIQEVDAAEGRAAAVEKLLADVHTRLAEETQSRKLAEAALEAAVEAAEHMKLTETSVPEQQLMASPEQISAADQAAIRMMPTAVGVPHNNAPLEQLLAQERRERVAPIEQLSHAQQGQRVAEDAVTQLRQGMQTLLGQESSVGWSQSLVDHNANRAQSAMSMSDQRG